MTTTSARFGDHAGARIGVITTSYPRWPGDAAGGFVAGHVGYLRATGAEVEVIAIDDDGAVREAKVTRVAGGGLFYRGGAPEALEGGARAAVAALTVSARMTAAVARRARRWDAVVAHWLAPSALAAVIAAPRQPLLAIAHGGDVHLLARLRLLGPSLRLLHARGATVAFVSEAMRARALASLPPHLAATLRTIVQPMGVDDHATDAIRAARAVQPAPTTFTTTSPATLLILARLVPIKSIATAIAALPYLATPARLLIAGDGPERATLMAAADALDGRNEPDRRTQRDDRREGDRGMRRGDGRDQPRVRFLGQVDAVARDRLLAGADAVLVPSAPRPDGRDEGTPMAALEALAAGVRVIASATGGLVELARHGAVLVPPNDVPALAAAIDHALAVAPAPVAEVGWSVAGRVLDEAWRRVPRYAPAAHTTQARLATRSDRPVYR